MSAPPSRTVFISYRRQDTSGLAGRLYDRLADHFGDDRVFMDVDTIALGVDFAVVVTQAVSACEVLLAIIGPRWLGATDEKDHRRLDDPDDIVALEIATALERNIRVIPILVEGAVMPRRQELPDKLTGLARRNAFILRHESFRSDADRLLAAIEPLLRATITSAKAVSRGTVQAGPALTIPLAVDAQPTIVQLLEADEVLGVAFSPDGRLLAAASSDSTARIWDVATGKERMRFTHDDQVFGVAFSPNGRLLATGSDDGTARIWDVATGKERTRLTHDNVVGNPAFSPDGLLLATSSGDETARIWEVATGKERIRLAHDSWVLGVAFSPDGQLLATTSEDRMARIWEVASGKKRTRLSQDRHIERPAPNHWGVAFSPDGQLLATGGSDDDTARIWDVATWKERIRFTHDDQVLGVAFSPDGRLLATSSEDNTARIWDVASGKERARVTHDHDVLAVAFSPDGRLLATGGVDDSARIWALHRSP